MKALEYSMDQTGPVADIVRILGEYNMIEYINNIIESAIVMSKGEWKKIVNNKVMDKENKEWTATSLLYRRLYDFKREDAPGGWLLNWTAHFKGKLKLCGNY